MFNRHKKSDYIFPDSKQDMMSETSIRRKFESVIKLINKDIEKTNTESSTKTEPIRFTPHQLRHTYVCILHKAGIDIKQAQKWTGHRDVKVLLNIYTHLDEQDYKESVDKVNHFLE